MAGVLLRFRPRIGLDESLQDKNWKPVNSKSARCRRPVREQEGVSQRTLWKKMKCPPHHITGGYLGRSYPEGEADQTSLRGWHWHLKFDHFLPVFTCRRLGLLYLWQYFLQHITLQRSRSSLERLSIQRRRWSVMQRGISTTAHLPLISRSPPAHLTTLSFPSKMVKL